LQIQVKDRTILLAGTKPVEYGEKASLHRRERATGSFDRAVTLPIEIGGWSQGRISGRNSGALSPTRRTRQAEGHRRMKMVKSRGSQELAVQEKKELVHA